MTDEDAIRELQRQWFNATKNGSLSDIQDLMTEDVVFLTPGRAPFGRREFIESFQAMKERVAIDCDGSFLEVIVQGDWAFATAGLDITVTPHQGATKHLSGNTLSVFKRMPDGKWRLFRDANLVSAKVS